MRHHVTKQRFQRLPRPPPFPSSALLLPHSSSSFASFSAFLTSLSGMLCEAFVDTSGGEVMAPIVLQRHAMPPVTAVDSKFVSLGMMEQGREPTTRNCYAWRSCGGSCGV